MYTTETDISIPFHDVDSMGVVWHGHYLKYFEVARCDFLDSLDYSYQAMADSGYAWPVVDTRLKFIKPLLFGQQIRVQCRLREWEYRLKLDYVITDSATGERYTKGYTVQVAVDMTKGEMCFETPDPLRQQLLAKLGALP